MQFIDLAMQYQYLKKRIDARIEQVLSHGAFIMGPEVFELEHRLAEYVGVKHAITCANGTDALQLSLMVLGIKPGDAVFCPTFTFFATAEVIALVGATPVFVDVDKSTFNICPLDLEKQIERVIAEGKLKVKAIISVDLFGLPANYSELDRIAKEYELKLIEDAAQGFGGELNGKKSGSFGDIATTSFFPAKPLGCYGDGGAVFTDSDEYAELLRSFRVHGKGQDKYDNVRIGMNSRLDTIQAAILLEKFAEFSFELDARNNIASAYTEALKGNYRIPNIPEGYLSSWAQYTLVSEKRDCIMAKLKRQEIPTAIYYGRCMHQQAAFASLGYKDGDFKVAESLSRYVFSLPMHPYMSADQIDLVTQALVTNK
ncbi:MAG: DegT/DnrJ/EryC1/StrS family aminotransferase [Pseudomonadales bacterium]|nr:DegT/DnrJ/EryC1/StrS family aminotransferase [Pseudomonadales bacterium]